MFCVKRVGLKCYLKTFWCELRCWWDAWQVFESLLHMLILLDEFLMMINNDVLGCGIHCFATYFVNKPIYTQILCWETNNCFDGEKKLVFNWCIGMVFDDNQHALWQPIYFWPKKWHKIDVLHTIVAYYSGIISILLYFYL